VLARAPHVLSKMLAPSHQTAMLNVSAHASASPANLSAAVFHLSGSGVAVLLCNSALRAEGYGKCHGHYHRNYRQSLLDIHSFIMHN